MPHASTTSSRSSRGLIEEAVATALRAPPPAGGLRGRSRPSLVPYAALRPVYQTMRIAAAAFFILIGATVTATWGVEEGLIGAGIAGLVLVHALSLGWRQRSAVASLLLDATATGAGLLVLGIREVGAAAAYLIIASWLLLPRRLAVLVASYVAGWGLMVHLGGQGLGVQPALSGARADLLGAVVLVVFLASAVGLLGAVARALAERSLLAEEVRQTRDRQALAMEVAGMAVWDWDMRLGTVAWSQGSEQAFGLAPGTLPSSFDVGLPWVHPDDRHSFLAAVASALDERSDGLEVQFRLEAEDGCRWAMCRGRVHRDAAGHPVRVVAAMVDTTQLERASEAIRESEQRMRTTVERAPVSLFAMDAEGCFTFAEGQGWKAVGIEPRAVTGRSALELFGHLAQATKTLERALAGEAFTTVAAMGGSVFEIHFVPQRDEEGRGAGVIGVAVDITERHRAEFQLRELLESRERRLRYERAIAACSRSLLIGAGEAAVETALRALLECTQVGSVFVVRNFDHPDHGAVARLVREVSRWEDPGHDHWRMVRWADMSAARDRLAAGEPFMTVGREAPGGEASSRSELHLPIFVDGRWWGMVGFTDYERERFWDGGEVELLRTAAEMLGAYWERKQAKERLQELVRSKDELLASVSHELRTPLAAVLGLAEELRDRWEEFDVTEVGELLAMVASQSHEMSGIIEDLLVAARSEIGTLTIRPSLLDVSEAARTVLGTLQRYEGVSAILRGEAKAWADPLRFRQIIRNLLTNAARYGGPRVELEVQEDGLWTRIVVRDDGPGIEGDDVERVFEPYYRAQKGGAPLALGLGLAVSRRLARLMSGDLACRRLDGWTEFVLSVPADAPPADEVV